MEQPLHRVVTGSPGHIQASRMYGGSQTYITIATKPWCHQQDGELALQEGHTDRRGVLHPVGGDSKEQRKRRERGGNQDWSVERGYVFTGGRLQELRPAWPSLSRARHCVVNHIYNTHKWLVVELRDAAGCCRCLKAMCLLIMMIMAL